MPGTDDLVLGKFGPLRPESVPGGSLQPRDAVGRDKEGERVENKRSVIAELHDAGAAEERSNGGSSPAGSLRQ